VPYLLVLKLINGMRTIFELIFYLQSKWISKRLKMFWRIEPKLTPAITFTFIQVFALIDFFVGLEMNWKIPSLLILSVVIFYLNFLLGIKKNRFHNGEKYLREVSKRQKRFAQLLISITNTYLVFIFIHPIVSAFFSR
jgi:hypothetical protein